MTTRYAVATVVVSPEPDITYALVNDPQHIAFLQQECRIYGLPEGSTGSPTTAPPQLRLALEEMAVGVANGFLRLKAAETLLDTTAGSVEKDNALVTAITQELTRQEEYRESIDAEWRMSKRGRDRLRVFQDLWKRGYIVTFGSKFGADFLIYKGLKENSRFRHCICLVTLWICLDNPKQAHAVALIVIKGYEEVFARVDVVSFCRMAKMIKKQFLFASVRATGTSKTDGEPKDDSTKGSVADDGVVYMSITHALLVSRQLES
ncbi:hypothetical protein PsorP6_005581 [Peronosclerospora sorghi]|uniref:Uncharacterized protein n=1 Tax=Peronosclerospora sorghi TaxID=230839 RepID=A0ACC0W7L7_9STRA|nr:hypothetical protein PsorP6_005581 [Peronosclerospora sorghi]